MFRSTKTFGHELGLSACFRQWRAGHSHCQYLHGYSLAVKLIFESEQLDSRHWVMDFGNFSEVRDWLKYNFDHKTVIAADDPHLELFKQMQDAGLIQLRVLPGVGCERFAEFIYHNVHRWLKGVAYVQRNNHERNPDEHEAPRDIRLVSVEVSEHGTNSAIYEPAYLTADRPAILKL